MAQSQRFNIDYRCPAILPSAGHRAYPLRKLAVNHRGSGRTDVIFLRLRSGRRSGSRGRCRWVAQPVRIRPRPMPSNAALEYCLDGVAHCVTRGVVRRRLHHDQQDLFGKPRVRELNRHQDIHRTIALLCLSIKAGHHGLSRRSGSNHKTMHCRSALRRVAVAPEQLADAVWQTPALMRTMTQEVAILFHLQSYRNILFARSSRPERLHMPGLPPYHDA